MGTQSIYRDMQKYKEKLVAVVVDKPIVASYGEINLEMDFQRLVI